MASRLAIFIDGGHLDAVARHFHCKVDYAKLIEAIRVAVERKTPEPVDTLRTYYYHCPPYQSDPPTADERQQTAAHRRFTQALLRLPRFEVREGRLQFRGLDSGGRPIFQQKRVDLLLGLDFALLCSKRQITHIALVAGDSDLIPAVQLAKPEGVAVWLFHGPRTGPGGGPVFHQDLWEEADERFECDAAFFASIHRA